MRILKFLYAAFIVLLILFVIIPGTRMSDMSDEAPEIMENDYAQFKDDINAMSESVDLVSYVPTEDLEDEASDDEADIIYATDDDESHFQVEEFLAYDKDPSDSTIDKIKTLHIPQLEKVRDGLGQPIIIRSAARSLEHEKKAAGQD